MAEKTTRVRIRVCIDANGDWYGVGCGGEGEIWNDSSIDATVMDQMPDEPVRAWHWVEADVPLPDAEAVIQGSVVEGE